MNAAQILTEAEVGNTQLIVAAVVIMQADATVTVTTTDGRRLSCDLLCSSDTAPLVLAKGDSVLIWRYSEQEDRGVVMGRIGPSHVPALEPQDNAADIHDELVIEAKKNLTLKCGEGSITIREDGKILIKGKDLVSHAQRMNRIKGGSVSIN